MTISDGQDHFVEQLICSIAAGDVETLRVGNDMGSTALHLAASLGNVRMCRLIAEQDSTIVGARNNDGETPFFLAVAHGRRDAFLFLNSICEGDQGYGYARKSKDGETILHSAVAREYFDLAFQIIKQYPRLASSVKVDGSTPLHLLAGLRSAFRRGSFVVVFSSIIYDCILVDELKEKFPDPSFSFSHKACRMRPMPSILETIKPVLASFFY